jgi:hypothetical protein
MRIRTIEYELTGSEWTFPRTPEKTIGKKIQQILRYDIHLLPTEGIDHTDTPAGFTPWVRTSTINHRLAPLLGDEAKVQRAKVYLEHDSRYFKLKISGGIIEWVSVRLKSTRR